MDCPCGNGERYAICCGALHRGERTAATAGELMRSRYSAYVVGDREYLLASWDPATRPEALQMDAGLEWRRLRVLGEHAGAETDDTGTVEFVAHFWDPAVPGYGRLHEHSVFRRIDGRWYYVGRVSD